MEGNAPATRPSLLARLSDRRNDVAWQTFHDAYGPLIYAHCRRHGLQHADAVDVVQDVLVDVARAMPGFRYDRKRGRFRAWLGTLTYRRLCRFWRRRRLRLPHASLDAACLAESLEDHRAAWNDDVDAHVLRQAMREVSGRVEPFTWQAFVRTWLYDEPAAQVARSMGRDAAWVYVAKSRVLRRVRREVERQMRNLALD